MGTSDTGGEADHGPKGRTATSYASYTTVMLLQGFNKITLLYKQRINPVLVLDIVLFFP